MAPRLMHEMTVEEARAGLRQTQTVLLPVGVVEQHGYHLRPDGLLPGGKC